MCQICDTKPIYYGEILPNWHLYQSTADADDVMGIWNIEKGEWYLAHTNWGSASFVWHEKPTYESDKYVEAFEPHSVFYGSMLQTPSIYSYYRLMESAIVAGFVLDDFKGEAFDTWFAERMHKFLENNPGKPYDATHAH